MAECRYCTHLAWPELEGTSWEPIPWTCSLGRAYSDQPQECRWFSREVGSDDDLGAQSIEPDHTRRGATDRAVTGTTDGLERISRGGSE
jgi:hypothetical protein